MDRAFGLDVPSTLDEVCHPSRTALIVYDMQAGIVPQIAAGRAVADKIREVLQAARDGGFRVFFTRHMSLPSEVTGASQLRRAKQWQRADRAADTKPAFPRDSPQFQVTPELAPLPSEGLVDKITMSAFAGTYLDMALRDCGINSFAIAGIALEVGLEPTVRHAADLGYIPIVVTDACGAGNAAAGERALASLKFAGDALLTESDKIIAAFRRWKQPGS
ncbi:MAG TPA: cysteine hydrolase [Haliangiales bacterium]|nr:cysteine hydrolase [Haliangiales bacterium]